MGECLTVDKCTTRMSNREFMILREFIQAQCGIKLSPVKKIMLEARLLKRLRILGIPSFGRYFEHLFESPAGTEEIVHMIDSVTTNKTDFFREPLHFSFLTENIVPEFMRTEEDRPFTVWSAGCSSGEEPYTLAMVLCEFREKHPRFRFAIVASDISTKVLEKARLGIYERDRVSPVPAALQRKYLLQGKDRSKGLVRIAPEVRSLVQFRQLNLMDDHPALTVPADIIFCRNVIIYFERATQEWLLRRLCQALRPEGYLVLGHSETVHGFNLPLVRAFSTIYRKMS